MHKARLYDVLLGAIVTEKATRVEGNNCYVFHVRSDADKNQVRDSVELVYGHKPTKVNILNMKGKQKRFGKIMGQRSNTKKAYVTMPEGVVLERMTQEEK